MSKKPVVLMILDGYGLNKTHEGNAVYEAKKPVMDRLMKECPFVEGQASGLAVGLPDGQMGNSEVGHLNMGAGRIVYQELTRITKSIQDGDFFKNEEFLAAVAVSYTHLKDFRSYAEAHKKIDQAYRDEKWWARTAMLNTASSGKFSSDRTIEEYVRDIWHLEKIKVCLLYTSRT